MNEIDTSTLEGKIAILTAFKEGKTIQHRSNPDHKGYPTEWDDVDSSCLWQWNGWEYRIKPLEFPKLPDGMTYHNPLNMTPEQFGEGFRPLVEGELVPSYEIAELWKSDTSVWTSVHHKGTHPTSLTYRVPTSHPFPDPPKPKVMVPLEPHDISPIDALRKKDRKDFYAEHWMKIDAVNSDGPAVNFSGSGRIRIPFKTLMNEWEIKRPGEDWKPCEKESAS